MYNARIIINDTATDGEYSKHFLLILLSMGAEITVILNDASLHLYLENEVDLKIFKSLK